jgi:hypothetical protein
MNVYIVEGIVRDGLGGVLGVFNNQEAAETEANRQRLIGAYELVDVTVSEVLGTAKTSTKSWNPPSWHLTP